MAADVWAAVFRSHCNGDLRVNSHSLVAAMTKNSVFCVGSTIRAKSQRAVPSQDACGILGFLDLDPSPVSILPKPHELWSLE